MSAGQQHTLNDELLRAQAIARKAIEQRDEALKGLQFVLDDLNTYLDYECREIVLDSIAKATA